MIARIDAGIVVQEGSLPMTINGTQYTTLDALRVGTGQDWRDYEPATPQPWQEKSASVATATGWTHTVTDRPIIDIRAETIARLGEISRAAQDAIVRSHGKSAEYSRNVDQINAADSPERTAFLTGKSTAFAGWTTYELDGVTVRKVVVAGNVQSFIDYVLDANYLAAAVGDAIVNERGRLIQLAKVEADPATCYGFIAQYQAFVDGKLAGLAKQAP